MDKVQEYLKEWTIQYVKNKDIVRRDIVSFNENTPDADIFVEFKERKHTFFIEPLLKDSEQILKRIEDAKTKLEAKYSTIVMLNSKENLKVVKNIWEKLAADPGISLYFVNPLSAMQKIWIVYPSTHNKISDKSTLGVLFEAVEETNYEDIARRL